MLDSVLNLSIGFAQQLGLVAIVIVAYTLVRPGMGGSTLARNGVLGVVFGAATALSILTAIEVAPGVLMDARGMLLALSAAFGGPVAAAISVGIAGASRLLLGGAGTIPGLVGIAATAFAALAFSMQLRRRGQGYGAWRLVQLGLLVAAVSYIPILLLAQTDTLGLVSLHWLSTRPFTVLGTLIFGVLLLQERRRRDLETRLEASVGQYTLLADYARDAITMITADGVRRYISPALSRILGYADGELIGRSFLDMVHPEDRDWMRAIVAEPDFGAEPMDLQYRMIRKDGEVVWMESSPSRREGIGPEDETEIICVVRDISKRKAAEHALQQAYRDLEDLTRRDPLTDLANRRHLDSRLRIETRRCARNAESLAVVMIDIDHFKKLNDTYGHLAGDGCLRQVAQAIARQTRRPGDLAARYGGEEFALVLPETDRAGAIHLAEQVASAIRALALPNQGGIDGLVTVSIGVSATVPDPDLDPQVLVETADAALYQAKRGGRNRVEAAASFGGDPAPEAAASAVAA